MFSRKAKASEAATPPRTALEVSETDKSDGQDPTPSPSTATGDVVYPSRLKLALILSSAFVSMFLVSLDRMIIATAIPQITDDFDSVTDIGWYGSAFLLTTCAFQMLYGKMYSVYSIKYTFLTAVLLFEIGSAVSGAAPSSAVLIVGRAVAGIGAAGITSGAMIILVHVVPLHKRPLYMGLLSAVFGLSSVLGPLLGGAFTTKVTWRWCFYINLPLGGVTMLVILFLLEIPLQEAAKLPTKAKLAQLDFPGTTLLVPGCVCLLLALQWGGVTYAWSNGRIVLLLVLAGVLLVGFTMVQIFLPKTATIPPRIFMQRSIMAAFFTTIFTGGHNMIFYYYLSIWFQAIQGLSAVDSGIRTLALVLSNVIASISTGVIIHRVGYYMPFLIAGICFTSVGAGLFMTLQLNTPEAKWIGYQLLYGVGMGLGFSVPNLAAQTVLSKSDIPIGASLMFFSQLLGGSIFISVGQNVLDNQLLRRLSSVPGFTPEMIQNSGATTLTNLPDSSKAVVLVAYNQSIRQVFLIGLILVCLSLPSALAMEWRSTKETDGQKNQSAEDNIEKGEHAAREKSEIGEDRDQEKKDKREQGMA